MNGYNFIVQFILFVVIYKPMNHIIFFIFLSRVKQILLRNSK